MRVMILVPGLPVNLDNIKGGVHSAVSNLLKGFSKFDIEVRVISFSLEVKNPTTVSITDKIEIHYSYEGSYPYHSLNYLFHGPKILKKHIREFNPDVIHYEEGSSFLFTRSKGLNGKKYLQTIHGMGFAEAKRKKSIKDKLTWYFNGVLQMVMLPENVIHLSQFSLNLFQKKKIRHAEIIPNAIIPQYFRLAPKPATTNSLLYIGVVDNNKNLIFLLKAMCELVKRNKKFHLNVLGDYMSNVYKQEVETYIHENNLAAYITFNGWVPQTAVLRFIEAADILVVSSKHESLPMVIAESMAAGKVVAASAVGGIPEMIDHGINGYLFNLSDNNGLVTILEDLHNNDNKIREISGRAIITAARYDCGNVAEKTIDFYNRCV